MRLPNLQRSCRHLAVSGATGMDSDCTRRHGGQNFTTRSNAWVGWSDDPKLRGWYPSMVFSGSKALIKRDLDRRTGIRFTKFTDNGHMAVSSVEWIRIRDISIETPFQWAQLVEHMCSIPPRHSGRSLGVQGGQAMSGIQQPLQSSEPVLVLLPILGNQVLEARRTRTMTMVEARSTVWAHEHFPLFGGTYVGFFFWGTPKIWRVQCGFAWK